MQARYENADSIKKFLCLIAVYFHGVFFNLLEDNICLEALCSEIKKHFYGWTGSHCTKCKVPVCLCLPEIN
jgi:hypothetical protein